MNLLSGALQIVGDNIGRDATRMGENMGGILPTNSIP